MITKPTLHASPARIGDDWGVCVNGWDGKDWHETFLNSPHAPEIESGDIVEVTTRSGKMWRARLLESRGPINQYGQLWDAERI